MWRALVQWIGTRLGQTDDDVAREVQSHLDLEAEELREAGLRPADARAAALRAFGNPARIREEVRDVWIWRWLTDFILDVRFTYRSLRRNAGFAATVVVLIAVGVGASTAIFSLLDAVVLRSLPVARPQELELITLANDQQAFSRPFFEKFRDRTQQFSSVLARFVWPTTLANGTAAERGVVEIVSGNYFSTLGVRPAIGRLFTDEDDRIPMAHPVAVVSFQFWRDRLASDPSIVGKALRIDAAPFEVIGIAPPSFFGVEVGSAPDVWVPIMMQPQVFLAGKSVVEDERWNWLQLIGRRGSGVSKDQAQAEASAILRQLQDESGRPLPAAMPRTVRLVAAGQGLSRVRSDFETPLRLLMAVVGLLLVAACASIANLLLARSIARQRETAIRVALGATWSRIGRQLLTESLVLAALGAALAVGVAAAGTQYLLRFLPTARIPFAIDVQVDARILGFALTTSFIAAIVFGGLPLIQVTRRDVIAGLKTRRPAFRWLARHLGTRGILSAAQVALSLLLLSVAGLFLQSLSNVNAMPTGIDTDHVVTGSANPSLSGYDLPKSEAFYRRLSEQLRRTPGVRAVGLSAMPVLGGKEEYFVTPLRVPSGVRLPRGSSVLWNIVSGDFFQATGLQIVQGRTLRDSDRAEQPDEIVMNESAARYFFGSKGAVGQTVTIPPASVATIVGVVSDAKYRTVREDTPRTIYTASDQQGGQIIGGERTIYARVDGDPAAYLSAMRAAVRDVDPDVPLYDLKTLGDRKRDSLVKERLLAALATICSVVAIWLAATGLYGVVAFSLQQRAVEIGIRISLGATRWRLVAMILRQTSVTIATGLGAGLIASLVASRWLSAQLYGLSSTDPATLAWASAVLAIVAIGAAGLPAARASGADPVVALRS